MSNSTIQPFNTNTAVKPTFNAGDVSSTNPIASNNDVTSTQPASSGLTTDTYTPSTSSVNNADDKKIKANKNPKEHLAHMQATLDKLKELKPDSSGNVSIDDIKAKLAEGSNGADNNGHADKFAQMLTEKFDPQNTGSVKLEQVIEDLQTKIDKLQTQNPTL
jgi:hypothetical protein